MKYLILIVLFSSTAHAVTYSNGIPLPGLPKSLGQKTMAGSTSVTIASDQAPVPVTFSAASSQIVTQGTVPWVVSVPNGVAITNTPTVLAAQSPNSNATQRTVAVTTSESTHLSPTNAIGLIIEAESGNATNIRWGISNTATSFLSTTVGQLTEPGRDSGFLPAGQGTIIHLISTGAGTNAADLQWVMSQ